MTGIERLREFAKGCRLIGQRAYSNAIGDIADQIERELTCDADTIENIRLIVSGVIDDMEHHILGHEGMEDSPVARWARELREAMGGHVEEVTDVATIRKDAYDAYEWMCEHGGLDYVMHEWQSRVPRDRYERRRQRLLDHIAECETALGRRNRRIEEFGHRVNDLTTETAELREALGRHCRDGVGDTVADSPYDAITPEDREAIAWVRDHGGLDAVKKLLDWVVGHCSTERQLDFDFWLSGRVMYELGFEEDMADRDEVERRLLARLMPEGMEWPTVDGKPVDFVTGYEPSLGVLEAVSIYNNGACEVMGHDGIIKDVKEIHVATPKVLDPCRFTHERPDSWERIEEDADRTASLFDAFDADESADIRDLVRRCRALAERERGE